MTTRRTQQQAAIRRYIQSVDRPVRVEEIRRGVCKAVPGIGVATVYRAVKAGLEAGWLAEVHLPGERSTAYELAGKVHHHHFECRGCGKVYDVEGCPGHLSKLIPPGFVMEGHELVLYGRCEACA
jgi:Fur family ferric uptake transcriptional regulator